MISKEKDEGAKDLEIELAIRLLQTEKSVFPENGRAEATCSTSWYNTSFHLAVGGCPVDPYLRLEV